MNDDKLLDELFGENETSINIALSYSRVSDFAKNGPISLIRRSEIDTNSVRIGSITDDLLTDDFVLEDKYYIFDGKRPTATLGNLADIIIKNYNEIPDSATMLEIINKNEYWKRSKDESKLENLKDSNFVNYLNAFYESKNKIVLSTNDYLLGKELADTIRTHKFSEHLFYQNYERYTQFKFEINYRKVRFRGIMDFVLIDHENKTVNLIDLKTGKDPCLDFMNNFIKYKYYFQEAIYTKAFEFICKKLKLKGYKLLPFKFLYISRYEKIPLEYSISNKWHQAALKGFTTDKGYVYKGLNEIIDEIKWHWQNKVFDLPKDVHESNGIKLLNDKFFKVNE